MSGRFPKGHKGEWTGPSIGWGSLDGNHHGPKVDGETTVLRSTAQIVQLDNGLMPPPRFFWGWRLWIYAPSGRCWNVDIAWRSAARYALSDIERAHRAQLYLDQQKARGEWPPKDAGGPDYLGAMLGASGLGLILKEVPIEPPAPMSHRCETCGVLDSHAPGCAENIPPDDCPRCRGCGQMDAGGGRCVVCNGSGLDPGEIELPEGVWDQAGKLMYECLSCHRAVELGCDPDEFDPTVAYCGGNPWCLP
jgi:hypothetical protein